MEQRLNKIFTKIQEGTETCISQIYMQGCLRRTGEDRGGRKDNYHLSDFFLRSVLCVDYHVISQSAYTFSVDCSRDPWKLSPPTTTGFDLILSPQLRHFISSSLFSGIIRSTCSLAHETNTAAYWACFHLSIQSEKLHTSDKRSSYMEHWQTIQLNKKGKERT